MSPDDPLSSHSEAAAAPDADASQASAEPSADGVTRAAENGSVAAAPTTSSLSANGTHERQVRCRYCGQRNRVRPDWTPRAGVRCGRCRLPLSEEVHRKFPGLSPHEYIHPLDAQALETLKLIPALIHCLRRHWKSRAKPTCG